MGVDEEDTNDPAYMPLSEQAAQMARSTPARPAAKRAASPGDDNSDADEEPKVQALACLSCKAGSIQTALSLCFFIYLHLRAYLTQRRRLEMAEVPQNALN